MRWSATSAALLFVACSGNPGVGTETVVTVDRSESEPEAAPTPQFVDIEVGGDTACVRRDDGAVYCWGDLYRGYSTHPRRVKGLPPAEVLSVSEDHACIIDRGGSLWCWGREETNAKDLGAYVGDGYGEPGQPHRIEGLERLRMVSAGGSHDRVVSRTCVIAEDGMLTCMRWEREPRRYEELGQIEDVAVGHRYVCLLKDGMHHCANVRRQRFLPVARDFVLRQGANGLTSVAVSDLSHCGHDDAGRLFCWGPRYCREHRRPLRRFGQPPPPFRGPWNQWRKQNACEITESSGAIRELDGSVTGLIMAREATTSEWWLSVTGSRGQRRWEGDYLDAAAGRQMACGLKQGGEISCWGASSSGQLGRAVWPLGRRYRLPFARVLADRDQICAVDPEAGVRCWGEAGRVNMGALGAWLRGEVIPGTRGANGLHMNRHGVCVDVGMGTMRCTRDARGTLLGWPVAPVQAMGGHAACSVHGDGKLRCRIDDTEVDVVEVDGKPVMGVTHIALDDFKSYVLNPKGLFRFGAAAAATPVPGAEGASQIAVGDGFYCVLVAGRVRCGGMGGSGQLGDGTGRSNPALRDVKGLPSVKRLRAADRHACAVAEDGRLFCWGSNAYGQLGDGGLEDHRTAQVVPRLEGVRDVSLGRGITCAMRADDALCWGRRAVQLLDGDDGARRDAPRDVPFVIEGFGEPPPAPTFEVVEITAPAPDPTPPTAP